MQTPSIVTTAVRRFPLLQERRGRVVAVSVFCFILALLLRSLYAYLSPSTGSRDGKRLTGRSRSNRSNRDKKKHGSSGGSGSQDSSSFSTSTSKKKKIDPTLPTVLMLVGIHGSGKSFWAARYVAIVQKSYVIISSDAVRSRLTGTIENYSQEAEVEAELLKELQQTLELRRSCILDDCQHNLSAEFRAKVKAMATQEKANCVAKTFAVKPSYAMARIMGAVEEGMVRYVPTMVELEEQVEELVDFEKSLRDDGWVEN